MLAVFADSIIEQSRADIADTAVRSDIARLESNLTGVISRATNWRYAITTNLIAWLLSIAITVLIVVAGIPGWVTALVGRMRLE